MEITCNGLEKEIDSNITVIQLMDDLELNPDSVVVQCDGKIISRDDYPVHTLKEGSVLELIRFVGGG